jgi:hypothetical protein
VHFADKVSSLVQLSAEGSVSLEHVLIARLDCTSASNQHASCAEACGTCRRATAMRAEKNHPRMEEPAVASRASCWFRCGAVVAGLAVRNDGQRDGQRILAWRAF